MKTAAWPLQQAVYARLTNSMLLMESISGVYDDVPEDTPVPFMQIGDDTAIDYSSKTWNGEEVTLTIHAWSGYEGRKEAKVILDLALQALSESPLYLGNEWTCYGIRRDFLEVYEDDGFYHGVMRLRVRITEK